MRTLKTRSGPVLAVGAVIAAVAISACSSSGSSGSDSGTGAASLGLIQSGTIQSAVTSGEPPMSSVTAGGQPVGFLVDLDNTIARDLGVKITYKATTTNGAMSGLTAHRYDLASISLVATPARQKEVLFSKPLYYGANSVVVRAGSPVSSAADLAGKRVGASLGSTQYDFAQTSLPKATLVSESLNSTAISQLGSGTLDAIVVSAEEAGTMVSQSPSKYKIAFSVASPTASGIGIAKSETKLQAAYNTQLAKLISNGTYLKLYDKWFGPLDLPFPAKLYSTWPSLKAQVAKDPTANPSAAAAG